MGKRKGVEEVLREMNTRLQALLHAIPDMVIFISNLERDPDYRAIVSAVVAMAHTLKLEVVAEGVETDGQLAFFRSIGCDMLQGFIFSEPLSAKEFERLLA